MNPCGALCGPDRETPLHTICQCEDLEVLEEAGKRPAALADLQTKRDLSLALEDLANTSEISRWLMATGRLPEFNLAREAASID